MNDRHVAILLTGELSSSRPDEEVNVCASPAWLAAANLPVVSSIWSTASRAASPTRRTRLSARHELGIPTSDKLSARYPADATYVEVDTAALCWETAPSSRSSGQPVSCAIARYTASRSAFSRGSFSR